MPECTETDGPPLIFHLSKLINDVTKSCINVVFPSNTIVSGWHSSQASTKHADRLGGIIVICPLFVPLQPALYPPAPTRMMTHRPSPVWTPRPQGRDSRSIALSGMKTARNMSAVRRCARLQSSMPTPELELPRMMSSCESFTEETTQQNYSYSITFDETV